MIVVDASAAVALLTDEGHVGQFVETATTANEIAFPSLMPYEVASALRSMCMRGALAESIAKRALRNITVLSGVVFELDDLADRVWQLRNNLTAYDAAYVALAELIDVPLLTLDARLVAAPGTRCRFVDVPAVS